MKNLIKFFITATILFTASCTTEYLDSSIASEETVEVFFTTNLADSSTRAYDDGENVDKLYYIVCDDSETPIILNKLCGTCDERGTDGKFSFSLSLIKSMTYNIYFWAQSSKAPYSIENGVVSINYANNAVAANNGELDAFYGSVTLTPEEHGKTQNISLTRPFAQLNALTSDGKVLLRNDVESFENVRSTATVEGVYSQFDLINGDVVNTSRQTVTFASTVIPAGRKGEVTSNDDYTHLSMNYLFVPERCVANVQFTFTATRTNNAIIEVTTPNYNDVPLKPNYKTNIIGKLLTDSTEFKIDVVDEWATDDQYILAGEVTLTEDLIVAKPIIVAAGTEAVLNLNGKKIINTTESEVFGEGEGIIAYGKLTINGEGTVQGSTMAVWARGNKGAEVTINGGTYKGCADGFAKGGRSVIYASSGNTININGGTFKALTADKTSYADKTNGVYAAVNVADNNGTINVYGGTFYKQNPAAPGTEPAAWNAAHPNGFVAKGYSSKTEDNGETYTIVPPVFINPNTSLDDILAAFSNGGTILLEEDIEIVPDFEDTNVIFNIPAGTDAHLDLNGKKITINTDEDEATKTYYTFVVREGGSLTIDGDGIVEATTPEPVMFYPAGDLVIENGTFIRHIPEGYTGSVSSMFVGTRPAGGWETTGVTINGGYFDCGYYPADLKEIDVEKLISGDETLVETVDDIAKRGLPGDKNKVRVALKDLTTKAFNRSYNYFYVYGGTFVGANPAWGDEGGWLPTTPQYLRPWSNYQGPLIKDQEFHEDGIVLPEGFAITKGTHEDGRPTYTVTYNK